MQVANQMGHSRIETTKNIYGHLFAQDRASILKAMNQAVTRLYVQEDAEDGKRSKAAKEALQSNRPPGIGLLGACAIGGGPTTSRATDLVF
ncbi:MAG: hypothetical protein QOH87_2933 [Trebonia sp.]|nr:hypothetical protein [Trebonia sp.]